MSTPGAAMRQLGRGAHLVFSGLVAVLLGGLLVLAGAQASSAHAELVGSTPEDGAVIEQMPAEAVLTFTETVQLVDGSIRLFAGEHEPVALEAQVRDASVVAALPTGLDDGQYVLSYRVVSADGHPISGAITFTVGTTGETDPAPAVDLETPEETQSAVIALSALQYLTLLVFAGLNLFDRIVLQNRGAADPRTALVLRWTGVSAACASILLIGVSALNVTGDSLTALVTPSVWSGAVLWGPATGATVVVLGTVGAYLVTTRGTGRRYARAVVVSLSLVALAAPVLVGHSQIFEPRPLIAAADFGHLLAGSFWAGGLVGLLLFLTAAGTSGPALTGPRATARVVQRFSQLAVWSVVLLAVSGTTMGIMIVGSFEGLFTSTYGRALMLKVGIIGPIVAIAAYNRFRLLPRLSAEPATRRWRNLLNRTLAFEASFLAVVVILTGFLTNLSPVHAEHTGTGEHQAAAEPVSFSADEQGLAIDGVLDPAHTGDNDLSFTLRYEDETVTTDEVAIRASLPEQDLGPFEVTPELDTATGEYTAQLALPVAGDWQIQVIARVSTFAEPIVTIPVTVR